jgi:phospholipid transport system substrate-binding protein
MKKLLWIISLAVALVWVGATWALAQSPKAFVRGILDNVMTIQNDPSMSKPARAQAIHRIIAASFDFAMMANDSLGPEYDRLSSGQRQEFARTFGYLFQDSYTRMVLNFLKKENIQYGQESQEGDRARVATTIVRPNENIPVTYMMRRAGGR